MKPLSFLLTVTTSPPGIEEPDSLPTDWLLEESKHKAIRSVPTLELTDDEYRAEKLRCGLQR
jgi:hypothetical protein